MMVVMVPSARSDPPTSLIMRGSFYWLAVVVEPGPCLMRLHLRIITTKGHAQRFTHSAFVQSLGLHAVPPKQVNHQKKATKEHDISATILETRPSCGRMEHHCR